MKLKALLAVTMAALATSPAFAGSVVVPGPEAGASLGAMALVVGGYLALRRRHRR